MEVAQFVTRRSRAHDSAINFLNCACTTIIALGSCEKNETADHSDFDGGEAESLDAAAVKETLIRADEVLPCRVLTSNVDS